MKTGKAYWSLHINDGRIWTDLVNANKNSTRRDTMVMVKYIRTNLKAQTKNVTDFEFMEDAIAAWNKLDEATKKYVSVTECIPVSLGLGWC